jgi:Fe-S-cluster containining protein
MLETKAMGTKHLKFVSINEAITEIKNTWINPKTGEYVNRCPWLRKLPKQNKYICRIHETKPEHCRNFPKSKRHALDNDCKGFSTE